MNLLFYTTLLTTLLLILILTLWRPTTHIMIKITNLACLTSTIPMLISMNHGLKAITLNLVWGSTEFNTHISLLLDYYTLVFVPTALFITCAIMEFATWYMASDPQLNKFITYLLAFLLAMLILTTANTLLQLFVGWEGVGIMSFLLISWWHARANATTAALQAVVFNRIGDIGLLLTLAWTAMTLNTWDLQQIFAHIAEPLPLMGLVLAAAGKSAQFGLHPWLPSAMEGPTPVSALLHSSTMVVAGVFLLVRLHPLFSPNNHATTTCLCLGAMTTTFAALCAITQNDIKKVIAFSTLSQLGLMVLTLGLNQADLAFLHVITHAFFKAMLFLCAGAIIHNLQDEQDIRKMGGMQQTMPLTTTAMSIGTLALAGAPFLAGFYTKDVILETMSTSPLNAWALTTTFVATMLTATYSLRLTYYIHLTHPRYTASVQPAEAHPSQTKPILHLAVGSIVTGLLITSALLPPTTPPHTMPLTIKLAALVVTTLGMLCAYDLLHTTARLPLQKQTLLHTSLTQLAFSNTLGHRRGPHMNLHFARLGALQLNDRLWYEAIAPMTLKSTNIFTTNKLTTTQTGMIKTYLGTLILLAFICLLIFLLQRT